ncbi:unnamed protein product [Schistocephalus solidus]|uniref:Pyr_redox_2 domain-containing protein n=1 Tax=Schistocephalus solidus TaxID=70667 RepID=A0A183TI67_SCHSO|nr:unnamed protein product [Schistocephalus solidus]
MGHVGRTRVTNTSNDREPNLPAIITPATNIDDEITGNDDSDADGQGIITSITPPVYDLLHIVPPMTPPEVLVKTAALSDSAAPGYVTVDRATTRHIKFPNIFSIGDCSNMPTSKTAAAIASQTPVLVENLLDVLKGGAGTVAQYDGYTSCPLITGETKGILAEFNYDLQPRETLPFDQATERWIFGYIKRFILPPLYWDGLLRRYAAAGGAQE